MHICRKTAAILVIVIVALCTAGRIRRSRTATIVSAQDASMRERLAAAEVRRYVYARTDALLSIETALPASGDAIVVATKVMPAPARSFPTRGP